MNRHTWVFRAAVGGLAWAWLGLGLAQAGVIPSTDPATLKLRVDATGLPLPGNPTVSLYQLDSTLPPTLTSSSPSRCVTTGTAFYRDVTDCWLPGWDPLNLGKSVFIVINGSTAAPTLVAPIPPPAFPLAAGAANPFVAALTTSAYPGNCTNFGTDTGPDFTLLASKTLQTSATTSVVGYELKPNDCGGMAVIQVATGGGTFTFILPKDGTGTVAANGIPEIFENLYGGNLNPSGDIDTGPAATSPVGDGISTADEYRGFIVSGVQARGNLLQKDIFVHLVNPQCSTGAGSTTSLLLAGGYPVPTSLGASATLTPPATAGTVGVIGTFTASAAVFTNANTLGEIVRTAGGRARILAVASSTAVTAQITQSFPSTSPLSSGSWQLSESLFANVYGFLSPERVRLLGYAPGSPNPVTSEWVDNFQSYTDLGGLQYTPAGSASDRVVNVNRLYGPAQKGIRVIECLDDGSTSPYGWALGGTGSPNTIGNVVIYTKRVVNQITLLISNGAPRSVQYSPMLTYSSQAKDWTPKTVVGASGDAGVQNFIISKALQFYVGMEVGHSLDLNRTASAPPHFAAFSGDGLDQAITSKLDKTASTSTFNTFYIPTVYGTADQSQLLAK